MSCLTSHYFKSDPVAIFRRESPKICTLQGIAEVIELENDEQVFEVCVDYKGHVVYRLFVTQDLKSLKKYTPTEWMNILPLEGGRLVNPFLQSTQEYGLGHYYLLDDFGLLLASEVGEYSDIQKDQSLEIQSTIDSGDVYYVITQMVSDILKSMSISKVLDLLQGAMQQLIQLNGNKKFVLIYDFVENEEKIPGGLVWFVEKSKLLFDKSVTTQDYWILQGINRIAAKYRDTEHNYNSVLGESFVFELPKVGRMQLRRLRTNKMSRIEKCLYKKRILEVELMGFSEFPNKLRKYRHLPSYKRSIMSQIWGENEIQMLIEAPEEDLQIYVFETPNRSGLDAIVGYYVQILPAGLISKRYYGKLHSGCPLGQLDQEDIKSLIYLANFVICKEFRRMDGDTYTKLFGYVIENSGIEPELLMADTNRTLGNSRLRDMFLHSSWFSPYSLELVENRYHKYAIALVK